MLCSVLGQAQELSQTIRGNITDSQAGTPLLGANVVLQIDGTLYGGTSDINGNFRIKDVPLGRHTLVASYIGYEKAIIPELLVGSGKEIILNIPLVESLESLDEIVIVADKQNKGEPLNDMASVSAISFSVEETSRFPASFDDPARAALSFPGVRGAGDDILNEIVIRGNSPRGLLWRIEGIEVPNPNHFGDVGSSAGGISMLSNNMLSRSDFYTGAFPAEYGNALSGIFDIHLRPGNNEKREYAIEAGLIGLQAAAEGPISKKSGSSYLANLRMSTLSVLGDLGIVPSGQEDTRFNDFAFKLNFPTQKVGTFTLWGLGGVSKQVIAADSANEEYYNEQFDTQTGIVGLKHFIPLNSNTYLESSISGTYKLNRWEFDSMKVLLEDYQDFVDNGLIVSSTLNRKFNAQHTARGGLIYRYLNYDYFSEYYNEDDDEYITDVDDSGSMSQIQVFGQWQYRINQRLTLNTGLHYNRLLLNGNDSFEPRIGAKWNVAPNQFVNVGFGVHSRTETPVIYLGQRQDENGDYYQANRDLELSKAIHYVVGYEKRLRSDMRFKTEIYYQDLYDVIVVKEEFAEEDWQKSFAAINTTGGYASIPFSNDGRGYNYGIELTIEKFFTNKYYFLITSSLFESRYHGVDRIYRNTRFNGNYILNLIGGKEFVVGRKKNNLIALNGKIIWAGNNRTTPIDLEESRIENSTVLVWDELYEDRLADYLRFDFGISYRKNKPKHTSIWALNIQNLTNRYNEGGQYFSTSSQNVRTWEQFGILPNLSYRIEF